MTVRETSAEAYRGIASKAATDREIIIQLVRQRGPMTGRQIASYLQMQTGSVSGRVAEAVAGGQLVELDEQRPCPESGRRVRWLAHPEHCPWFQMGFSV